MREKGARIWEGAHGLVALKRLAAVLGRGTSRQDATTAKRRQRGEKEDEGEGGEKLGGAHGLVALKRLAAVLGRGTSRQDATTAKRRQRGEKEDEGEGGERLGGWVWVGLAWGGALLSKYHGVFLPLSALIYLGMEPLGRRWLRRPGPWLAVGVALVVFAPVVGWNAAHGWASFVFQGSRAMGGGGFRLDYLAGALAGPFVYLLPWVAVPMGVSVWGVVKAGRERGAAERFLLVPMVVPVVVFLVVACRQPVLPHWSLVGLLPGFVLLGRDWARRWEREPARMRRRLVVLSAMPVVVAGLVLVQLWTGILQKGGWGLGLLPVSRDPTLDLYGWDEVVAELEKRGLLDLPETFVFTSKWYHSGQLAFALGDDADPPVLCYSNRKALGFGQWSRPEEWVGKDGILVVVNHSSTEPGAYEKWFERIEPLGEFAVERGGAEVKKVWLYRCVRQTKPFPFGGAVPEEETRGARGALAVAVTRGIE